VGGGVGGGGVGGGGGGGVCMQARGVRAPTGEGRHRGHAW
jgi:hypothetical protein